MTAVLPLGLSQTELSGAIKGVYDGVHFETGGLSHFFDTENPRITSQAVKTRMEANIAQPAAEAQFRRYAEPSAQREERAAGRREAFKAKQSFATPGVH